MTPQEALHEISTMVYRNTDNFEMRISKDCYKSLISALEKQIPKKPKVLKVHDISNYKYGVCECGEHIADDEKFCSNCGQALDWGEEE